MPIKDFNGEVMGVAQVSFDCHSSLYTVMLHCCVVITAVLFDDFQVINKKNAPCFTQNDEKVFADYLQFCGIGLRNAQLYEKSQLEVKRNQVRNLIRSNYDSTYIGHLDLMYSICALLLIIYILIMSLT